MKFGKNHICHVRCMSQLASPVPSPHFPPFASWAIISGGRMRRLLFLWQTRWLDSDLSLQALNARSRGAPSPRKTRQRDQGRGAFILACEPSLHCRGEHWGCGINNQGPITLTPATAAKFRSADWRLLAGFPCLCRKYRSYERYI